MRRTFWFASALALLILVFVAPVTRLRPDRRPAESDLRLHQSRVCRQVRRERGRGRGLLARAGLRVDPACLNDVDCLKTYCQATTIRSGWKLESAK